MADDRYGELRSRHESTPPSATQPLQRRHLPARAATPARRWVSPGGSDGEPPLAAAEVLLFAPRLGFAWDMNGNGKSALRGGLGLFYSRERVSPAPRPGHQPAVLRARRINRTLDSRRRRDRPALGRLRRARGRAGTRRRPTPTTGSGTSPPSASWCATPRSSWPTWAARATTSPGTTNLNQVARRQQPPASRPLEYARNGDAAAALNGSPASATPTSRSAARPQLDLPLAADPARQPLRHGLAVPALLHLAKSIANDRASTTPTAAVSTPQRRAPTTRSPDLDRGAAAIDRTHVFNGSLVLGPADLRGQVGLREERPRRLAGHVHRRGRLGLPDHGLHRQRPGASGRRQPHRHGLGAQPAAEPCRGRSPATRAAATGPSG